MLRRGALSLVALLIACTLVVVLTMQNKRLEQRYVTAIRRYTRPADGMLVPSVRVPTLSGDSLLLGESTIGSRQVLLAFTTTCPYCRASLPAWERLARTADSATNGRVRVIGVSLDTLEATARYATEHHLPYPVALMPSGKYPALYRLQSVPQVIVLDAGGRALYARGGALTDSAAIDSVIVASTTRLVQ